MKSFLGIDIGNTKIFSGRFLPDGHCLKSKEVSTGKTAEKFFFHLFEAIDATILEEHKSISFAFAGTVFGGKILDAPNIPFFSEIQNFPEIVSEKYGKPVSLVNDAHAFARGEAKIHKAKNVIGVTLGTGVGVGIFCNGEIFADDSRFAEKIGYSTENIAKIQKILSSKAFSEIGHEAYLTAAGNFFAGLLLHFDPEILVIGGGFGKNGLPPFLPKIIRKMGKYFATRKREMKTKIIISVQKNAEAFGAIETEKIK